MENSELSMGNGKVYPNRKRVGFPFNIPYSPFLILFFFLLSSGFSQWTPRTGEMGPVYSIVESPWGDLYAGTSSGVRRLEEGTGWVRADSGLPVDSVEGIFVYDLVVKEEYLFAATDSGVYRHSGGDGWVATMDTNLTFGRLVVKDSALFASVWWNWGKSIAMNKGGIYRSYDNGSTWAQTSNNGWESDTLWTRNLTVLGSSLFMAGENVYRSDDDGESWWVPHDDSVFEYIRTGLGVMGSRLYAGGGGGIIYRSDDSGSTWEHIGSPVFAITFLVHEQMLFAAGTKGRVFFSLDSGDTWYDWSDGIEDERRDRDINTLLVHDGYLLAGTYYSNCSANECFDPLGRIWQRPLSEVVSIGDGPFVHIPPAVGLKVIRGSGGEIEFTLQQDGWVDLSLYTPDGKLVATLAQGVYGADTHRVSIGVHHLPGGLYVARFKAPGVSHAEKVLLEN